MRYKVDKRVGCAAIVDTQHSDYINNEQEGLESDYPYVVEYIFGEWTSDGRWEIDPIAVNSLQARCNEMNNTNFRVVGADTSNSFIDLELENGFEISISRCERNTDELLGSVGDLDEIADIIRKALGECD